MDISALCLPESVTNLIAYGVLVLLILAAVEVTVVVMLFRRQRTRIAVPQPECSHGDPLAVIEITGSTWTTESTRFDGRISLRLEALVAPDYQVPLPSDRVALYALPASTEGGRHG